MRLLNSVFLVCAAMALGATHAFAGTELNLDKSGLMLKGYDPVSYFLAPKPTKGDPKFETRQGGAIYRFASEENKQLFLKNPAKYEPKFGGWCAYAVADSKSKVDIDPESFVIQNGKLLVFYNGFFGDTRKKWLHTESKTPDRYYQDALANWPATKMTEP